MCLFGTVRVVGSYYHCASCHNSQQPWDEILRLNKRRVTPAAAEAISLAGLLTSFGRAARQTLKKLTGIVVSESTVLRVAEDAGRQLSERLKKKQKFGPAKSWHWQRDARGQTCGYTSLDHVSIPQQGPNGAKAEGRMAAVALVYNPQSRHDEKLRRGQEESVLPASVKKRVPLRPTRVRRGMLARGRGSWRRRRVAVGPQMA